MSFSLHIWPLIMPALGMVWQCGMSSFPFHEGFHLTLLPALRQTDWIGMCNCRIFSAYLFPCYSRLLLRTHALFYLHWLYYGMCLIHMIAFLFRGSINWALLLVFYIREPKPRRREFSKETLQMDGICYICSQSLSSFSCGLESSLGPDPQLRPAFLSLGG